MTVDWVWISLLALWQRWWPDRPGLELLDDKMQAGYARDAEHDSHAAVVTWLDAWSDVVPTLVTCDAMERRGAELGLAPVAQAKNHEVLDAGRSVVWH